MIGFVVALHCEAAPLKERFQLKKTPAPGRLELFRGQDASLVVSGVGRLRSAIATAVLGHSENLTALVNLGLCGSPGDLPVGQLVVVNRLLDRATDRAYFPDMLARFPVPEVALETHDRPVTGDRSVQAGTVVDMEGAAFFEAATHFLDPARILCLKVVSDHLEGERFSKAFATALIRGNLASIASVLEVFRGVLGPEEACLSPKNRP